MAALTANPHSALPSGPSWDETIVPSLRKRLETESRILTKRLSTISITDEGPPNTAQDMRRTVSPPQNHVGDYGDANGTHTQRPSAIPRPSYSSRASERPIASPSPPPPPPPAEPIRKSVSKRKRTQSTPFPFNAASAPPPLPNGHAGNPILTPSSSSSISSRVQTPPLTRAVPSRIPTVASRVRSGSQSSQRLGSLNGAKASLPPSHKLTSSEIPDAIDASFTPASSLRGKVSSSSLARQRIIDERPPFSNDPPPRALESEFTGRPSAEEERTFQHWYRGDMSRNGGVGEVRVGKRMEMLDIANYGHALRGAAGRTRAHEEPTPRTEGIGVGIGPRKRAESVSSRERASIYIDPQDETVTGRVLDEMPLTDIEADETDYERDQHSFSYNPQTDFVVQYPVPPTNHNRPHVEVDPPSTRLLSSKSQSNTLQSHQNKGPTTVSLATTSEPSMPAKANQRERGRVPAPANSRSGKSALKTKVEKRSKSAADPLRSTLGERESVDYAGLADAVPETSSPIPRNGNWDEVILPTVARRMGIEYEKEDPETAAKRKVRESRVAPAPGTFGYDHTKYKPPRSSEEMLMDEFGQRQVGSLPAHPEGEEQSAPAPPVEESRQPPVQWRARRETMPSPAPFSHYAPNAVQPDPDRRNRGKRRERQDVPQILVSPPTMDALNGDKPEVYVEEEHGSGCCKCIVM